MKKLFDTTKARFIRAYLNDFDGDLEKWKDSFYQLWRYQLTWDFAYKLELAETRSAGVHVSMLIKPAYENQVLDTMESLGYCNIRNNEDSVAVVHSYDLEELEMVSAIDLVC